MEPEVQRSSPIRSFVRAESVPRIDFFIIGAPKCGTGSLYTYLRAHPGVFMPDFKEPHYYSSDYRLPRQCGNPDEYAELFDPAPEGTLRGEASTWYLRSEVAIEEIRRDHPAARFIVMLRNPSEMVRSLHAHQCRRGYENIDDLATAWAAQEDRAAGRRIPHLCSDPKFLQYRWACALGEQLERLFATVPRSQVLVHIFEEFFGDPRAGYERTLAFLDLPSDGRDDFPRINQARDHRSRILNRAAGYLQYSAKGLYGTLKQIANTLGLKPGTWFTRMNRRASIRQPVDPDFAGRLHTEFAPEIARVERVLGRRVEAWQ